MKSIIQLFLFFLLAATPLHTFSQEMVMCFEKEWLGHRIYFHRDGTYYEFFENYISDNVQCSSGINFSEGNYDKRGNSYVLTSSKCIKTYQHRLPFLKCEPPMIPKDSLYLEIRSPYEQMLEYEKSEHLCNGNRHPRNYVYNLTIVCGFGRSNRVFERIFNSKHAADSIGIVREFLPYNVTVRKIKVSIRCDANWAHKYDVSPHKRADFTITTSEFLTNAFVVEVPSFNYFLLTYKSYRNKRLRFIDDNMAKFDGHTYTILK